MATETENEKPGALPRRILLVEDNLILAMNAEDLLLELGADEVVVAKSLDEAQALCDRHEFDFALLDLNLGNETSIPIAERLHQAAIPFVFASGFDDHSQLPPGLGHYPILRKPYMLADLERTIRAAAVSG